MGYKEQKKKKVDLVILSLQLSQNILQFYSSPSKSYSLIFYLLPLFMAFIGEAALSAFFKALFGKLTSSGFKLVTEGAVRKEIMNWETTLRDIQAVLADAEGKQLQSQAVKNWLADLQDLAYDVDDILDELATEALERKLMKESQTSSSKAPKFASCTGLDPSSIMFNYKMMPKIKDITRRLEALATRKNALPLIREITHDVGMPITIPRRQQSTSLVNEANVRGRDEDKKAILDLLFKNDGSDAGVYSVIPIVGMGGIGKTTLAQLVYNDESIKDHFDLRAWVCVSDKFDPVSITKTILLSLSEACEMNDLNLLQVKLKEKLSRKKFLLVLDDVWSHSYNDWSVLRPPFDAGEPGSRIIVTTRDSKVSSNMTTAAYYKLQCLSEEDSLRMLAHDALETEDFTGSPDLKEIGLEIVKKCDGLPLAIKTIGGLLRTRVNRDVWKGILESAIWNLPQEGNDVIPALWLSYYYLPSQLKQCFAYCSLIPKDYEFNEKELVLLWMAEGFLNEANTRRKTEDLGSEYFRELVSRSFFQASSENESMFVMHDLINDLAQFVGGEKYFRRERHVEKKSLSHIRHSSYIMGVYEQIKKFEIFFEVKSLRTFLPFEIKQWSGYYLLNKNVLCDLLSRLKCLRVFSLKRYKITEIPDSIENLRHLRYLDFSYTQIKCLPDSVCKLYNLETLLLRFCKELEKLPSKIGILDNLCHLDIAGAKSMKEMPSGIGNLTNLQALSNFIVGQGDALNIREMQNLLNLKGQLSISELQNVSDSRYAWEAMLSSKPDLNILELEWSTDFNENLRKTEVVKEVLDLLRPHEELKALAIKCYPGLAFPNWIEDPSFKNLRSLKFADCRNCLVLPAVGKLPLLKDLYIKGMKSVTRVRNEFYGENWPIVFPSLETLHFEDMLEWEEWKACEARKFHCLRDLRIVGCPNLIKSLPENLPSLEKLEICDCQKLVVSISNLPMLCALKIQRCKKVVIGSFVDLWSVKKITLSYISSFACVRMEMMKLESIKVEDLEVRGCEELVSLWQAEWGWMVSLKSLRNLMLINCPQVVSMTVMGKNLKKLSGTSQNITCLEKLEIVRCPKLVSLLADNLPSTLKSLVITKCENLLCLLEDGENINFSRTSLIEDLEISGCEALKSLPSSSKLPMGLKMLNIRKCPKLEFVAQEIGNNNCLKCIFIESCKNIQYLPQGMDKLEFLSLLGCEKLEALPKLNSLLLRELVISHCRRMTSIPEGVLPTNLAKLSINGSNIVKAVMEWGLHRLTSLIDLNIDGSDCIYVVSFPERGLPTNVAKLSINGPNIVKAVMEWGLHRLTSLKNLVIDGSDCIHVISFPQKDIKLPPSLNYITISKFKNLRKLSPKGFQHLSSLQSLNIINCPELKSLPKKELLPSLLELFIRECPLLEKRCKRDKGKYQSYIADIPRVQIS